jgi:APA family basic amino acid/polyamine antiporter
MLKRDISKWDFVLLLINGTIGSGIFGLPSKIFAQSGFYSIIALIVCAAISLIIILNFAEVASRFAKTGGPYLYTLEAFGRFPAYIIGWLILVSRLATYAALINLFVSYLSYFHPVFKSPVYKIGSIIFLTMLLTIVNYRGVKSSARLSNFLAISKVSALLFFIVVGLFFINPELIHIKQTPPKFTAFSSSVLLLIFAFSGFESILVNTGELKDPKKNIPFALIFSITFIASFYILIQIVCVGTLPGLATSDKPLTDAAKLYMGPVGAIIITIGAIISIGGTLHAIMFIGSRVPFALSEARQFPGLFSQLHKKFHTPVYSLLAFSAVAILVSVTGSFIYAVSISVITKILQFLVVCFILLKLRKAKPSATDYYKLSYGPAFAVIGIITSIWLLSSSKLNEFRDVLITVVIGIGIYGAYQFSLKRK